MTDVVTPAEPQQETVNLLPVSQPPRHHSVLTVCKSPVGAHVGLWYRDDDVGERRHLHLAFHFQLKNDLAPSGDALWIEPRLDEQQLKDVRRFARTIAKKHEDGRIPYAFQKGGARFLDGALELSGSLGLTCATFVELVFQQAGVSLLDTVTWEDGRTAARRAEDEAAQRRLVDHLKGMRGAEKQAALVEQEVGCTRIRAEEVAAASGMTGHPVPFARAEPEGARILSAVRR